MSRRRRPSGMVRLAVLAESSTESRDFRSTLERDAAGNWFTVERVFRRFHAASELRCTAQPMPAAAAEQTLANHERLTQIVRAAFGKEAAE